jgi:hemerythrin
MLLWSETFETGHPRIDSEHRSLINYVNQLEGMSRNTNPNREQVEFILKLVEFVETYTAVHFKHEESCMVCNRCPAYQENKVAHEQFLQFFQQFKRRFKTDGCRPDVLEELHTTCSSWIQSHILRVDMKLKPYVGQKAA